MTSTDSREEQWLLTEGFNGVESTEYFVAREKLRNGFDKIWPNGNGNGGKKDDAEDVDNS